MKNIIIMALVIVLLGALVYLYQHKQQQVVIQGHTNLSKVLEK